jgi:uncharacterized protein
MRPVQGAPRAAALVFVFFLGAAFAPGAGPLFAQPSFDCSKASNTVERTICQKALLCSLDVEMAALYSRAVAENPNFKTEIRDNQIEWVKSRNRACAAAQMADVCLERMYYARIGYLNTLVQPARAAPGGGPA